MMSGVRNLHRVCQPAIPSPVPWRCNIGKRHLAASGILTVLDVVGHGLPGYAFRVLLFLWQRPLHQVDLEFRGPASFLGLQCQE